MAKWGDKEVQCIKWLMSLAQDQVSVYIFTGNMPALLLNKSQLPKQLQHKQCEVIKGMANYCFTFDVSFFLLILYA